MTRETTYMAMELWGAIFCCIAAFCTTLLRQEKKQTRFLTLIAIIHAATLFTDSIAWSYRGNMQAHSMQMLVLSNFFAFFFHGMTVTFFSCYVLASLKQKILRSPVFIATCLLYAVFVALLVATLRFPLFYYFDENHFYHRGSLYWISQVLVALAMLLNFMLILVKRKSLPRERFITFTAFPVVPLLSILLQSFIYGWSLSNIAVTICILLMFIEAVYSQACLVAKQARTIENQQEELRTMQTTIALSQIKPHFLYNVLNSIYVLCGINLDQARSALSNLSDYLRTNIDSIEAQHAVPFSKELEHIKSYLELENLRCGGKIEIKYDIQVQNFTLPPLTVQPLVENAVRHGLSHKEGGGALCIRTRVQDESYIVDITDNGIGFDVQEFFSAPPSSAHIGIRNVKERLFLISNGTLLISSAKGHGTTVTLSIPMKINF